MPDVSIAKLLKCYSKIIDFNKLRVRQQQHIKATYLIIRVERLSLLAGFDVVCDICTDKALICSAQLT